MGLEAAFLRDIRESPDDDTPRLVYADWLEEQGDADRAEFIRAQCRLARLRFYDDDWPELDRRQGDLLRQHGKRWGKPTAKFTKRVEYIRGFVGKMTLTGEKFLHNADAIFAACPLLRLRVLQAPACFEQLLGCEALLRIRALDLGHQRLGMNRVMALCGSPNVAGLTELDLASAVMRPRGLAVLAASPHLGRLRALNLHHNDLSDDSVELLATSRTLTSLTDLDLSSNILGSSAAGALAEGPAFRGLESLTLHGNRLDDQAVRDLLAGDWPRLRKLNLNYCYLQQDAIRAIAGCPRLPNLAELHLEAAQEGVRLRDLCASPHLGNLRVLDVSSWPKMGEDEVAALAEAPFLPRLRGLCLPHMTGEAARRILSTRALGGLFRLKVTGGYIGPGLGKELAAATHLNRLTHLMLALCELGAEGVAQIAGSEHLAGLTELGLSHNRLGEDAFGALIASPYLNHLQRLDLRGNHWPGPSVEMREALCERFGKDVCEF